MSDTTSPEKRDLWRSLMMHLFCGALLIAAAFFAFHYSVQVKSVKDAIQLIAVILIVPGFIYLAVASRLSAEAIAALIGALVGFAIGKFG